MATVYPKAGQLNAIGYNPNTGFGTVALVSFATPVRAVKPNEPGGEDLQQFRVHWRATPGGGSYADIELYEGGRWLADLVTRWPVSGPASTITATWDAALLKNKSGADVQVRISGSKQSTANLEIGAVEWSTTWGPYVEPDYVALSISGKQPVAKLNADQTIALVDFAAPTYAPLTGADLQRFRVHVRPSEAGYSPTVDIELWDEGAFVATLVDDQVITAATTIEATWNASSLTDASGASVQCRVVGTTDTGVSFIEVGAVEWQTAATPTIPADPNVGSLTFTGHQPSLTSAKSYARPGCGTLSVSDSATIVLWDAVTEDIDGNPQAPDGYYVYYQQQPSGTSGVVDVTSGTTTTLFLPEGDWYVWVTAYYGAEESDDSQTISFSTEEGLLTYTVWTHGSSGMGLTLLLGSLLVIEEAIEKPLCGSVTLTGYQPGVKKTSRVLGWDEWVAQPATMTATGGKGGILDDVWKYPVQGALTLTGYQPTVTQTLALYPTNGAVALTGYAPSFASSILTGVGSLTFTGRRPTLRRTLAQPEPETGELTLTGHAPDVSLGIRATYATWVAGWAYFSEIYDQVHILAELEAAPALFGAETGTRINLIAGEANFFSKGWVCTHPPPDDWNTVTTESDVWTKQTTPTEDWNG